MFNTDYDDSYHEVGGDQAQIVFSNTSMAANEDIPCYWVIRPERKVWQAELSQMKIWIEQIEGGSIYVLQGTSPSNITNLTIEAGLEFAKGAPLVVSTNDDLVMLFSLDSG